MAPLTMQITLNGQAHLLPAPTTLTLLLLSLGLADKPVVIELNRAAVFPRDFAETSVKNGDQIEIVTLAAGG